MTAYQFQYTFSRLGQRADPSTRAGRVIAARIGHSTSLQNETSRFTLLPSPSEKCNHALLGDSRYGRLIQLGFVDGVFQLQRRHCTVPLREFLSRAARTRLYRLIGTGPRTGTFTHAHAAFRLYTRPPGTHHAKRKRAGTQSSRSCDPPRLEPLLPAQSHAIQTPTSRYNSEQLARALQC